MSLTAIIEPMTLEDLEAVAKIEQDSFEPVSYTHLDVYKRQMQVCLNRAR